MPGFKDFVNGTTLPETDLDDYLAKQVMMKFASVAARTAALTGFFRAGLHAYLDDLRTITVNTAAADTWSSIGPVHGALPAWAPAITQSGAVTCTVTYATYSRLGRKVDFDVHLTVTGTGSASNAVVVTLPVAAHSSLTTSSTIGIGTILDLTGTSVCHTGILRINAGSASVKFQLSQSGQADATYLGATGSGFTAALAAGDMITMNGKYEAAADA